MVLKTREESPMFTAPQGPAHRVQSSRRYRRGYGRSMSATINQGPAVPPGPFAMVSVTFLVTDVVFGDPMGAAAAAIAAAVVIWFWFGLPLSRKVADQADAEGEERSAP